MNWENTPENVEEWFGFVYLISKINANPNEKQFYIGCKQFSSKTRRPPLKGNKRKRIIYKTSDWVDYFGSSKELLSAIESSGRDKFKREILHLTTCKWETKYLELKEQINRNVLCDDRYFNGIINLRIGKCPNHLREKYGFVYK